ncbi:MAG: ATP phosphoribosyltransferase regulatory subunit [Caldilineaceae bacterium]|nr:ATP phosphoribosyltransferase regulatory subunit [Caldilineaceae bacterium]
MPTTPSLRPTVHTPSSPPFTRQGEIPRGVADYFWTEAYTRRQLEGTLLRLFRTWGYQDVIPPMFEYADTFQGRSGRELQTEMYRFLDRDGSTLALRADMTIPVARLVGVRLHDRPMPQRHCYAGSVFRYTELQAGRQREFGQAGCELIGAGAPEADAEIIALTVRALAAAGLRDFRIVVGQIQYFHGLLQDLNLDAIQTARLQQAIDRNSEAQLAEFLHTAALAPAQRRAVEELPHLSGSNAQAIIDRADRHCLNSAMHGALDNLRAVHAMLVAYGVDNAVYLDLAEINNLGYYTGITFEVLTHQLGFPVGSGGRYDNLLATFGPSLPAVGVALGLDRILLARQIQDQTQDPTRPIGPDLLVAPTNSAACLQIVEQWRQAGLRVAVDLAGTEQPDDTGAYGDLRRRAQQAGARFAAVWTGAGFDLIDSGDPLAQIQTISAAAGGQVIALIQPGGAQPVAMR